MIPSDEKIIELNKLKVFQVIACWIFFLAGGLYLATHDEAKREAMHHPIFTIFTHSIGWAVVVFVAMTGAPLFKKMFDRKPGLVLSSLGITDNSSVHSAGFIPWAEISGFGIYQQITLTVLLVNPQKYINSGGAFKRAINNMKYKQTGSPIFITPSYTLKIEFNDLLNLFNEYFRKYGNNAYTCNLYAMKSQRTVAEPLTRSQPPTPKPSEAHVQRPKGKSAIEVLFPLCGVTLGKTTVDELAKLGSRTKYIDEDTGQPYRCYEVNGLDFWYDDGQFAEHMYLTYTKAMPELWEKAGFRWELSFNDWIKLFSKLGWVVNVTKKPIIDNYDGHQSFAAELEVVSGIIELKLAFRYSRGTTVDSLGTLYSLWVEAVE